MRVAIRTDASLSMSSGHVMRCLTLAQELRRRGAEVSFLCRSHPGNLSDLLESKGYPVHRLAGAGRPYLAQEGDPAHAPWLGVPWQEDAEQSAAALAACPPERLIIDHYAIDRRWQQRLRPLVGRIMVIDDLADRRHDCDLLLDQNLYPELDRSYRGLAPDSCRLLLGPEYALLRPEFAAARSGVEPRSGRVGRVLVFFGGVDLGNETEKALSALAGIAGRNFEVNAVVGVNNPHRGRIEELCLALEGFQYHCQVDNMAQLMARADLSIGAGGATTLERCALGLPSLVLPVALNQEALCRHLAQLGVILLLDRDRGYRDLPRMLGDRKLLARLSLKALQLVPCNGTERVVQQLLDL